MNARTEQQTLKDIAAGKYRDTYLVYARKSTDEPDNQKNSIAFQKVEGSRFTKREGLPMAELTLRGFSTAGVVSERHSAFKEAGDLDFGDDGSVRYRVERPKFHRLASCLAKRYFKGVVFLCWDRASRNKGDELIILDQHGAHERILYERLSGNPKSEAVSLAHPVVARLPEDLAPEVWSFERELAALGFEFEPFGAEAVRVLAAPASVTEAEVSFTVAVEALAGGEDLAKALACRGSRKFGEELTVEEMRTMLNEWAVCEFRDICRLAEKILGYRLAEGGFNPVIAVTGGVFG